MLAAKTGRKGTDANIGVAFSVRKSPPVTRPGEILANVETHRRMRTADSIAIGADGDACVRGGVEGLPQNAANAGTRAIGTDQHIRRDQAILAAIGILQRKPPPALRVFGSRQTPAGQIICAARDGSPEQRIVEFQPGNHVSQNGIGICRIGIQDSRRRLIRRQGNVGCAPAAFQHIREIESFENRNNTRSDAIAAALVAGKCCAIDQGNTLHAGNQQSIRTACPSGACTHYSNCEVFRSLVRGGHPHPRAAQFRRRC